MNISKNTTITGWGGNPGTLQQALTDRNLHTHPHYYQFGKRVQKGEIDICLAGEWKTALFESRNGWMTSIAVY